MGVQPLRPEGGDPSHTVLTTWVDRSAFRVVDAPREAGMELDGLAVEGFRSAMREIGRRGQENRISVAAEQLATEITPAGIPFSMCSTSSPRGGSGIAP